MFHCCSGSGGIFWVVTQSKDLSPGCKSTLPSLQRKFYGENEGGGVGTDITTVLSDIVSFVKKNKDYSVSVYSV